MDVMSTPAPRPVRDLEEAAARIASRSSPAYIWRTAEGQRLELSGRVIENWAAKTANLLTEQCDASPGDALVLEGPAHWRLAALGFGALRAGLDLLIPGPGVTGRLWAGLTPSSLMDEAETALLVAHGGLAQRYDGPVGESWPEHVLDFVAEVRSCGDLFFPADPIPADPRLQRAAMAAAEHPAGTTLATFTGAEQLDDEVLWQDLGIMLSGRAVLHLPLSLQDRPEEMASVLRQEQATLLAPAGAQQPSG